MSEVRDAIRAKILQSRKPEARVLTFFGEKIELRQMTLAAVMKARQNTEEEQFQLVNILVEYSYIPDTDEKVFEEGDRDALLALPFGQDFVELSNALAELTSVNFTAQKPDSEKIPSTLQ